MRKLGIVSLLLLAACSGWKEELPKAIGLGVKQHLYETGTSEGTVTLEILSDAPGTLRTDESWLTLGASAFSSDADVQVSFPGNEGKPRIGRIFLSTSLGERRDTVVIMQMGQIVPSFSLAQSSAVVYNGEGDTSIPATVQFIADEDFTKEVIYPEGIPQWVSSVTVRPDAVVLRTIDNPSRSVINKAVLRLKWEDGWGKPMQASIDLIQANADNMLGVGADFPEVRALAAQGRALCEDDIYIDAYVVSDVASGNVAENPNLSPTIIDYTVTSRSAYIESLDGQYGFLVEAVSAEDMVLKNNTRVRILLNGASVEHYPEPDRWKICDFTSGMLLSSEDVDARAVPAKRKHIGQLTDDDIYTRVTLTDCEMPIRKGSLTPLNELYTLAHVDAGKTYDRISKAALLLRDIDGNSMYIYTNTTCPYRRDGTRLNYGSGSITGVIVHEKYRRFVDEDSEDEDECGNIGRYQIRHFSRADFNFSPDFAGSFSGLVTEYRYLHRGNADKSFSPTDGSEGWFSQTSHKFTYASLGTYARGGQDYSCLGPIGYEGSMFGKNTGCESGFGIILDDGTNYMAGDSGTNTSGDGKSTETSNLAWRADFWYNPDNQSVWEWLICFSTKNISSEKFSMQLSMLNQYNGFAPRYWRAEWSLGGDVSRAADWNLIGKFSCPDFIGSSNLINASGMFKPMDFPLPSSISNKDEVYIRLIPDSLVAGTANSYSEGSLTTNPSNSSARNAINYFAVRYNK
ncbi:MAG: BACON domain-containing protein [Bacteroidales bacterium]|nr:BACON domain-containing protein [Bacteroidales bacterium]